VRILPRRLKITQESYDLLQQAGGPGFDAVFAIAG